MTYGYNTLLLDYDIAITAGTENRGARTPVDIKSEIIRKFRETSDFT